MASPSQKVGPVGLLLLLFVAVAITAAVIFSQGRGSLDLALQRIQSTGVVRIGYANEAPYGYLDSSTGRITGEAPEIAKVILRKLGATEIKTEMSDFGSLIPGLKAGRFDVIAAGMYITPQRAQEISFSNPTYAIGEAFLVTAGNPLQLHSFEDVAESESARIGVMGGSVEHGYAKTIGVPESRIVVFPDYSSAVEGLKTDRVDAVAATILTVNDLLRKAGDNRIERADPFTDPIIEGESVKGYGAFGFRQQDTALRDAFNRELATFIGTPEHLNLVEPFGFSEETLPGDVTVDDIVHQH